MALLLLGGEQGHRQITDEYFVGLSFIHVARFRQTFRTMDAERKEAYAHSCLSEKRLQTLGEGSKTLICILLTKLNIRLHLERVFLNFAGYSFNVTQMQENATKPIYNSVIDFSFQKDANRSYAKTLLR
ncbi:hypothetical protein T265_11791 [Opisthorchis viverrini]|uniref:Uncharacterized protein n=1 Tax=Opisthorchis viverrini TaxID=6198 RepID=A0A074ZW61_OPIVI|nr:hypothetical protein T265_11791 [Opisthorchis viverrini]KER19439.1 hypothetical protein T265_11791 [Opisthorchis viverrini]